MNKLRPIWSTLKAKVAIMFVIMAIYLGSVITAYWLLTLKPKLRSSAEASASAIAQAQSQSLEVALSVANDEGDWIQIHKALEKILLLLDSNTEQPFVLGVKLKLDPESISLPLVLDKLEAGVSSCRSCFTTEIPIYSTSTRELLGIVTFLGNDRFFQNLKFKIRQQILGVSLVTLLMVIISWMILASLIKPLSFLAKSLQNIKVSELTPLADFPNHASEEIVLVKKATDGLLSEIKKYIHILDESNKYTESIFSSVQDCLLVLNNNNIILEINQHGAAMLGYTQDELIGKNMELLKLEYQHKTLSLQPYWKRVDNESITGHCEARCLHKSGKVIPILFTRSKWNTFSRDTFGVVCTIKDISAFKEAENIKEINILLEKRVEERTAELKEAQQIALRRERLATVGQLTATVSHELRNPLGTIRNSMYTVEKNVPTDDMRLQKTISRINRSISRCDKIIEELLDFTRVQELNPKPVLIDTWLRALIDEYQHPEEIHIGLQLDLPEIRVNLDSERMQRVLINILDNACQSVESAMNEGKKPAGMGLTISTRRQNNMIVIACKDIGLGLAEDEINKVFEPLYSTKNFGVGLGLPLVKQIVENHGGRVEMSSVQGEGVLVEIYIPYNETTMTPKNIS